MRPAPPSLVGLVRVAAPLWSGEAAVFRAYFDAPWRTVETDRRWLALQARKEAWDHVVDPDAGLLGASVDRLRDALSGLERGTPRHAVLALLEGMFEEFAHYVAFADLHDALGAPLDPWALRAIPWPENDALAAVRARHRAEHGATGVLACRLTEGGYATLFREGARLVGRGGFDERIAAACADVLQDEVGHMLAGFVPTDDDALPALVAEQMVARIHMRSSQFGHPLAAEQLADAVAGRLPPHPFDWERAGWLPPSEAHAG